ncbi:hypothetical protein SASPL_152092 [Salvia splendens]|uniref:Cysteine-rich PDZ-binding protein n=1 Tax=Salvia splendens TaxID=180675 RepID=A0A8X8Z0Z0_SALSN|nr:hypothetical protein SASPL_152092 [Salvia splendens]
MIGLAEEEELVAMLGGDVGGRAAAEAADWISDGKIRVWLDLELAETRIQFWLLPSEYDSTALWSAKSVSFFPTLNFATIAIGEKKLGKVIVPDKWKDGAHNTTEGGGRKINENKLLSKKNRISLLISLSVSKLCLHCLLNSENSRIRMFEITLLSRSRLRIWAPYGQSKCTICKQQVHQNGKYCHTCAYSKGVCAMCGKQVLDTKLYKQSNV